MSERTPKGLELRYANSVADLEPLEPIWNALQDHHERITPELGVHTPKRSTAEAWRIRRSKYERWLQDPDTFFAVAEVAGEPVGYAFVTIGLPYASWATGERLAELETLSVLPEQRSAGIGAALLRAVWTRLEELGVEDMQITTTITNVDAQRFYERRGFRRRFAVYYGKSGNSMPAEADSFSASAAQPCSSGALWRNLPGGAGLRLLEPRDAGELHALIETDRGRLAPWMPWAPGQTFADTVAFIDRTHRQLEGNDGFQAAILREGRIVGVIGHHGVEWDNRSTGIGYWLAASEEGRGTMTEATQALVDHAFSAWHLNRVEIRIATGNARSMEIPKRIGFRREGTLRDAERIGNRYVDLAVYSMLEDEWLSRSRARRR